MTYEDITLCPHFSFFFLSYRLRFFGGEGGFRNAQSPVRAKFSCRVRVGQ